MAKAPPSAGAERLVCQACRLSRGLVQCAELGLPVEVGRGIGSDISGGVTVFPCGPQRAGQSLPHTGLELSDMSNLRTAGSRHSRLTDTPHYCEVALIILDFGEKSLLSFFSCKSFTIKHLLCHC